MTIEILPDFPIVPEKGLRERERERERERSQNSMPVEVFKIANRFIQRNITVVFASNVRYNINFKLSKLKWIV